MLQVLDCPQPFDFPWLIGILKFLVFISVPLFVFRLDKKLKSKLILSLVYLLLIISTYFIPFWKIKASFYLSDIQDDYSEIVNILEQKGDFWFLIYDKQGDSLRVNPNDFKSNLKEDELNKIKTFMDENYYVEIHEERNGIALIYRRFLDNRSGFILCGNQECRAKMDSTNLNNETYYQFNEDWYHFSAR